MKEREGGTNVRKLNLYHNKNWTDNRVKFQQKQNDLGKGIQREYKK